MVVTVCGWARCGSSIVAPLPGWPLLRVPQRGPGWTRGPEPRGPRRGGGERCWRGEARRGRRPGPDLSRRVSRGARQPRLLAARALGRPWGPRVGGDRESGGRRAAEAGGGGREEGRGRGEGRAPGARGWVRPVEEPRADGLLTCCPGQ